MRDPAAAAVDAAAVRRFLTFRSAGTLYALPAEYVLEVIHVPAVARVPHSPPSLLGIANLRGTVLPLVGLRELLGATRDVRRGGRNEGHRARCRNPARAWPWTPSTPSWRSPRTASKCASPSSARSTASCSAARFARRVTTHVAKILDIKRLLGAAFAQQARAARQLRARQERRRRRRSDPRQCERRDDARHVRGRGTRIRSRPRRRAGNSAGARRRHGRAARGGARPRRDRRCATVCCRCCRCEGCSAFRPQPASDGREKVVVMKIGGAQVGLVADRARAILAAPPSAIDAIPPVLAARTGGEARLKAIYRGEEGRRLVSILMPEQLFREDVMRRLGHDAQNESTPATPADSPQARADSFWCSAWARTSSGCRSKPSTKSAKCRRRSRACRRRRNSSRAS